MKISITIVLVMFAMATFAQKATNYWDGSFNSYWHNANNWSLGHIPTSTEDVVIPNGMSLYPAVDFYDETIKSLVIHSGAYVRINAFTLTVSGDVQVYGLLDINDADAFMECNNITWQSGSQIETTDGCSIKVNGTWEFAAGANVQIDEGLVWFYGSGNQYIRSKDADCYFKDVYVQKSAGVFGLSSQSTATCRIKGYLNFAGSNYSFTSDSPQTIQLGHNLKVPNSTITMALDNGTIEFTGNQSVCSITAQATSYINNLIVNTGASYVFVSMIYGNTFEVKGDVTINSGNLKMDNMTLKVGGDWTNNVGSGGFTPNASTVIFNGSGHQYCSDETFNNLEVSKSSGAL
ncbi:MAG TPA: hypothetical protein PLI65_11475, partial [Bacteroidales bacterium]|nr:hypothetical protein [Bacteroidales bacterium]